MEFVKIFHTQRLHVAVVLVEVHAYQVAHAVTAFALTCLTILLTAVGVSASQMRLRYRFNAYQTLVHAKGSQEIL